MANNRNINGSLYLIVITASLVLVAVPSTEKALAIEQNNATNTTSNTPIDPIEVIKQSEQRVNNKMDQVREALISNNTSEAMQNMEEVQQEFQTFVGCATSLVAEK